MNSLLQKSKYPFGAVPFSEIKIEHYLPALKKSIADGLEEVNNITQNPAAPTFENTVVALEQSGKAVERIETTFFNLLAAEGNQEMQALAKEISPLLTDYQNDILFNSVLFARIETLWQQSSQKAGLDTEDEKLLEKTYKNFVRQGAALTEAKKEKLRDITKALSKATISFGENVLNDTNDFSLTLTDSVQLCGLPDSAKEAAKMLAKAEGKEDAWVINLQYPSYLPFMTYAANRDLRAQLYRAFSAIGFRKNKHDNCENIRKITTLRHQRAQLLAYASHADFVLEERMAKSVKGVDDFLSEMLTWAKPAAEKELEALRKYAHKKDGITDLQPWDFAYYAEKQKMEKHQIDDEQLKPYFQLNKVLEGIFSVANKLYGISFYERNDIPVYHKDVLVYEVKDEKGELAGLFYADFFPRKTKRNGAWMTYYRGQYKEKGKNIRPHVSIVCNFTKPTETLPSLLTFDEVKTLFHEFGHALHSLLAQGKYASLSGPNVYWDFVELPSQLMENWAYEKECLNLFAHHYQKKHLIPEEMIENIRAAANYMEGYQTVRQISFGMLDMAWHRQAPAENVDIFTFENKVLAATKLLPPVAGSCRSTAFSHIFQGGYSAGYYSYKWAEVLDADAFAYFKSEGIFNKKVADSFRKHILSKGGSVHPAVLYRRFRGKDPSPKALLRRSGLLKN